MGATRKLSESKEKEIAAKLQAAASLHGFLVRRLNNLKGLSDMMVAEIEEAGVQYNLSHRALLEAMQLLGIIEPAPAPEE